MNIFTKTILALLSACAALDGSKAERVLQEQEAALVFDADLEAVLAVVDDLKDDILGNTATIASVRESFAGQIIDLNAVDTALNRNVAVINDEIGDIRGSISALNDDIGYLYDDIGYLYDMSYFTLGLAFSNFLLLIDHVCYTPCDDWLGDSSQNSSLCVMDYGGCGEDFLDICCGDVPPIFYDFCYGDVVIEQQRQPGLPGFCGGFGPGFRTGTDGEDTEAKLTPEEGQKVLDIVKSNVESSVAAFEGAREAQKGMRARSLAEGLTAATSKLSAKLDFGRRRRGARRA